MRPVHILTLTTKINEEKVKAEKKKFEIPLEKNYKATINWIDMSERNFLPYFHLKVYK